MSLPRLGIAIIGTILTFVLVSSLGLFVGSDPYRVSFTLDSATGVVKNAPVRVDGFPAGTVADIEVVDGKAKVTLELDEDFAPLHDGATATIGWRAVLSERQIEIVDGDAAEIPAGGAVREVQASPVELDAVLAALDEPTRESLKGTVENLTNLLGGAEAEAQATLASAGPAVQELSNLLKAVGTDGPAINGLVSQMSELLTLLANREGDVQSIVTELDAVTTTVASRRTELRDSLAALPQTLQQATTTLDQVPATVDAVDPLLQDLAPATATLASVSDDLAGLLVDLEPLVGDLGPLLGSADELLAVTPGLLDTADVALPGVTTLVGSLQDPVAFLRPYTPEVVGFFTNWASAFANYDSNGNFARIHGQAGTTSFNENPGVVPPGIAYDPFPAPGAVVGQTWTDAAGEEIR